MGVSFYMFARSQYGCCGNREGYCYVCWNPHVFGKIRTYYPNHDYARFVGVQLTFAGKDFLVCSTHLPAYGMDNSKIANEINEKSLKDLEIPVIIGGDFNIQKNYFKKCPKNLSDKSTFYNGGYDSDVDEYFLEEAKYDFVVSTRDVKCISFSLNKVDQQKTRWPNEVEGSDHTATRLRLMI